jgi:hypothetical protein
MNRGEPNTKESGGSTPRGPATEDELVDEASLESFPCSDPPSFGPLRVGMPSHVLVAAVPDEPVELVELEVDDNDVELVGGAARRNNAAVVQGFVYVATGLWPLVHMRSFEAVTGPKLEGWLVKTVGLLVTSIGVTLLVGSRARDAEAERPLRVLATTSALALAAADVWYVAKRRIKPVYLLDAMLELSLAAGWLVRRRR